MFAKLKIGSRLVIAFSLVATLSKAVAQMDQTTQHLPPGVEGDDAHVPSLAAPGPSELKAVRRFVR